LGFDYFGALSFLQFLGAWAEETFMNICFPLSIAIGFVPRLFPFLSGLLGAEEYFSAFIVEKMEAELVSESFVGARNWTRILVMAGFSPS
jgi:hypothetical protein